MPVNRRAAGPRYLLVTSGSHGDLHPFIGLTRALLALGRAATLVTNPYHGDLVRAAGLPYVPAGAREDIERIVADPAIWNPRRGIAVMFADFARQAGLLVDALDRIAAADAGGGAAGPPTAAPAGPRIAIVHPLAVPAAAIARALGRIDRIVVVWLAPTNLRTCTDPLEIGPLQVPRWVPLSWRRALWRLADRRYVDPVAVAQVNRARAAHGLPPIVHLLDHMAQAPDLGLALFPDWFAAPRPDWPRPLLQGGFPLVDPAGAGRLPAALEAFLRDGPPPLVFTAGTENRHAAGFLAAARDASLALGRRALLLSRDAAQVPAGLPPSIRHAPYAPLADLLPQAAALVHHGGIGTSAEALRAGVPQLVTPFAWDQFGNAARLVGLGVARQSPVRRLRGRTLARALAELLADGDVALRCRESAARLARPADLGALLQRMEAQLALAILDGSMPAPADDRPAVPAASPG